MYTRNQIVTIFGGTGFLGRYVVRKLAQEGFIVRVAVRHPEAGTFLKTMGEVGQINLMKASVCDENSLRKAIEGADYVINCVGILTQNRSRKFLDLHVRAPEKIAEIAAQSNVKRLIHVSSLGAHLKSSSKYLRTKALGENAALKAFPETIIMRPGVIFGLEDRFINRFAEMMSLWRVVPLIGGGQTKLQPVYVGNVASAIQHSLTVSSDLLSANRIFELAGPEVMSFQEIQKKIRKAIQKKVFFLPIPFWIASIGSFVAQIFTQALTFDQVKMLKKDYTLSEKHLNLKDLGIKPSCLEDFLPAIVARFYSPQRTHPFSTLS